MDLREPMNEAETRAEHIDPVLKATGADPDHSEDEERMVTFGMSSSDQLLVVAHTVRGEAIRVINARIATQHERRIYEEG